MAVLGLSGLAEVNAANRQVFDDNFLTAETTSGLASDLGRVEVMSLRIATPSDASSADRLRAQLNAIAIPEVETDIAALIRLHAGDPAAEYAQIARIPVEWNAFLPLTRQGLLAVAPRGRPSAAELAATAKAVEARLGRLIAYVSARRPVEVAAAASAHAGAQHTPRACHPPLVPGRSVRPQPRPGWRPHPSDQLRGVRRAARCLDL